MESRLFAVLSIVGLALAVPAFSGDLPTVVKGMDRDGNGKIGPNELGAQKWQPLFLADADEDGYLTLKEMPYLHPDRFGAADSDRDGKLTMTEFLNYQFVDFGDADKNGDGLLSVREIQSHLAEKP